MEVRALNDLFRDIYERLAFDCAMQDVEPLYADLLAATAAQMRLIAAALPDDVRQADRDQIIEFAEALETRAEVDGTITRPEGATVH